MLGGGGAGVRVKEPSMPGGGGAGVRVLEPSMPGGGGAGVRVKEPSSHCVALYNGTVVKTQMTDNVGAPYEQRGLVRELCVVNVQGNVVAFGVEVADPSTPTIAATMLKTAPPIDTSKVIGNGNPAMAYCQGYGGAEAGFVALDLSFQIEEGQSDMCVFGDGSMASAWSLAYVGWSKPGDGWWAIRQQVSDKQIFLGVTAPGNIFTN